jgi:hypothetical protein
VRGRGVADVGDGKIAGAWRRRHSPAHHGELAFGAGITQHRREIVRKHIEFIRGDHRQRGEIRQLQRAGISTTSAEARLDRMLNNIDGLCAECDRLKKEQPNPMKGKVLGGRRW